MKKCILPAVLSWVGVAHLFIGIYVFYVNHVSKGKSVLLEEGTHWSSAITDHSWSASPVNSWDIALQDLFWAVPARHFQHLELLLRDSLLAFYKFRPFHRAQLQSPLGLLPLSHPGMVRVSCVTAFQEVFFKGFSSKSDQSKALLTQPPQQRCCSPGMLLHSLHR